MTINIYIGDNNKELAVAATASDPEAFLIDHSNYKEFLDRPASNATVYTSLGDLPKIPTGQNKISKYDNAVYSLLDLADNIFYCPPAVWSDNKSIDLFDIINSLQGLTEYILYGFKQQKNNVHNLDLTAYSTQAYTRLVDSRKTNNQQLWIAGCSFSHGVGVNNDERYGQLLADLLRLPVSFLTRSGSSIPWAVDQIVRSDICSGDIIVLGLTSEYRFPYWKTNNSVWHVMAENPDDHNHLPFTNLSTNIIDRLITDNNCFYQSVIRLYQLVNFCNKLDAKLLIVGLLESASLALHLSDLQNFISYKNFKLPFSFIDLGADNKHPGPLQHQLYADFCQSALKQLNYI
jgi:hypothetical protein